MIEELNTDSIQDETLHRWLEQQADQYQLCYLLAHAEDGIIWGHFPESRLRIAHNVFPEFPPLRLSTLQQCRIFSEFGEILLWRDQMTLRSRLILQDASTEWIEEDQILWGTSGEVKEDFTKLQDGQQGLNHAVPRTDIVFREGHRPVRLRIRHYVCYDEDTGVARIYLSRLVNLFSEL
ncbi:TIGR03984 family CRISPR-associated protein [Cyanobacteria bacterium FACHB-63]|nr:TIGR03984 family CRISPR-associated protein [Cyanobacteria bacterium FACHB-63]